MCYIGAPPRGHAQTGHVAGGRGKRTEFNPKLLARWSHYAGNRIVELVGQAGTPPGAGALGLMPAPAPVWGPALRVRGAALRTLRVTRPPCREHTARSPARPAGPRPAAVTTTGGTRPQSQRFHRI